MANGTDEGRPETVKDGERREARGSSGSVSLRSLTRSVSYPPLRYGERSEPERGDRREPSEVR